jgi:hypothetical protein
VAPVSAKTAVGAGIGAVLAVVVALGAALASAAALLDPLNPFSGPDTTSTGPPAVVGDIPADYLALYVGASTTCPGLPWSVLAGVGKIETDHGRATLPGVHTGSNSAGAQGPMQFLRPTFDTVTARHPVPPGGATPPSPYDPHDAIYTAAAYLCDSGAHRGDLHSALLTYNHAQWYVNAVLAYAHHYATQATTHTGPPPVPHGPAHSGDHPTPPTYGLTPTHSRPPTKNQPQGIWRFTGPPPGTGPTIHPGLLHRPGGGSSGPHDRPRR